MEKLDIEDGLLDVIKLDEVNRLLVNDELNDIIELVDSELTIGTELLACSELDTKTKLLLCDRASVAETTLL